MRYKLKLKLKLKRVWVWVAEGALREGERLINDSAPMLYDVSPVKGPAYFSPINVRKLGRR